MKHGSPARAQRREDLLELRTEARGGVQVGGTADAEAGVVRQRLVQPEHARRS